MVAFINGTKLLICTLKVDLFVIHVCVCVGGGGGGGRQGARVRQCDVIEKGGGERNNCGGL